MSAACRSQIAAVAGLDLELLGHVGPQTAPSSGQIAASRLTPTSGQRQQLERRAAHAVLVDAQARAPQPRSG